MRNILSQYGHYLLITYAFQILGTVQTNTASDNLKLAEKFANTGNYGASETLPDQYEAVDGDSNTKLIQLKRDLEKFKHDPKRCKNYASNQCAQVIETNPEAKNGHYIVNKNVDEYMLTPCDVRIWFVIELCETIQATHIMLANYELSSSMPKDFTVYFSDTYPTLDWKLVGEFTANNSQTLQTFDLELIGFGKFIRVDLSSHYGDEDYCPISEVRVHGHSMVDEYEKSEYLNTNSTLNFIKPTQENPSMVEQGSNDLVENRSKNLVDATLSPANKPSSNQSLNLVEKNLKKTTNKTSVYRKYKKTKRNNLNPKGYLRLITEPFACGSPQCPVEVKAKVKPLKREQQQTTPQPVVVNRTSPLKPSVFVELSNKVKALETSLKEEMDRRLNDTDNKYEELRLELRTSAWRIGMIVISYCCYKLLLEFF